ncbi:MAG TPA: pitrilysin family protein [Bryobacteraceae bacterium]|nr:pitrilysin family protein [Bryobacteraceae bacterium]
MSALAFIPSPPARPPLQTVSWDRFALPDPQSVRLSNGLSVTMIQWGTVPKVLVSMVLRAGRADEGRERLWLRRLLGMWMIEGTHNRGADAVAAQAATMGGSIGLSFGEDLMEVSADVLTEWGPALVELMADVLQQPLFPERESARLKRALVRKLEIQQSQARAVAHEAIRQVLYPGGSYGCIFPTSGALNSYGRTEVMDYYESCFVARRTHVCVIGRFDAAKMLDAIERNLGGWRSGTAPFVERPAESKEPVCRTIDRPGSTQSTVLIGVPVAPPGSPGRVPLELANAMLGGSFSSRITSNIREDKGYTYTCGSSLPTCCSTSFWLEVADVEPGATREAIRLILHEVDRFCQEPPTADELMRAKAYTSGALAISMSSRSGLLSCLKFDDLYHLGWRYPSTYLAQIRDADVQDVCAAAARYLRSDRMSTVIVADLKELGEAPYMPASPRSVDDAGRAGNFT